ncbi:uncharacterized protein LOC111261983 isoform X5 [Varroa jacobsoni]|uniref:uncharacterized protein LOC111261983 isoform X5 n=1 Tax=Varroa jacobsoni TaxID=62625 RepID=UPI000BF5F849|nr:uncharacterized protein LOC111261983 isoform X5 [Varroa jacobsoni]
MTELFMYQLSPVPPGDSIGDKIGPLPRHGAITLDGNRRWGHSLGRHPGEGHVEAIEIIGWIARFLTTLSQCCQRLVPLENVHPYITNSSGLDPSSDTSSGIWTMDE